MFTSRRARFARAWAARSKQRPRARLRLTWLEDRVTPASLLVTDGGDTGGSGQLRALLATANNNGEADTITFDPAVAVVTLASALPTYTENQALTITGNGKLVTTINAPPGGRIFHFDVPSAKPTITITDLTLKGGSTSGNGGAMLLGDDIYVLTRLHFTQNTAGSGGAVALYGNGSIAAVNECSFVSNNATLIPEGGGGAISIFDASGSITIAQCTFSGNSGYAGGGVHLGRFVGTPTISLNESLFSGNTASIGGAFYANNGVPTTISYCQFNSNYASGVGGACVIGTGGAVISNNTFSENTARDGGGAMYTFGPSNGPGATIDQCTFTKNVAQGVFGPDGGGALLLHSSRVTISNSTIYDNTAKSSSSGVGGGIRTNAYTRIFNSNIIAGNKIVGSSKNGIDIYFGVITTNIAGDSNLIGTNDKSGVIFTGSNQFGTDAAPLDPLLNPLADNGGPMLPDGNRLKTMSLKAGSPALDMGNNTAGFANDQRGAGFARVINGKADVGAFEVQGPPTVTSVTFGDGMIQRSMVKQIVVIFSEPVAFMGSVASAFTVTRTGSGGPIGNVESLATPASGPANSVTITFAGSYTQFGSLIDRLYDFTISAAQVSGAGGALDGNNDGTPGGSYLVAGTKANGFYRLFGDGNGNGSVDLADLAAFRTAFNSGPSVTFDFDNDDNAGLADFVQIRMRYNFAP